jgi:hypothetical protein
MAMHPLRKESVVWLVLSCLLTLALATAAFHRPHWLWLVLLGCVLILSMLTAWRVFVTPDDWYRAKEFRQAIWFERHPYFTAVLVVSEVVTFIWLLMQLLKQWLS